MIQINKDDNRVAYFFAECEGTSKNTDETENIADSIFVSPEKFAQMIVDGLVNDQYTIKAFTLAKIQLFI